VASLLMAAEIAAAEGGAMREIPVAVRAPDAAWTIRIESVHRVGGELWVVAALSRPAGAMAAQVITTVTDRVRVAAPEGEVVKVFVLGKTWSWRSREPYEFPPDRAALDAALRGAEPLYPPPGR
jgi:hypothetical protein